MNIETVLLLVILTFGFGFLLDQWSTRARRRREWKKGGPIFPNTRTRPSSVIYRTPRAAL